MAKPCSVCVSPDLVVINKLLVSGAVYREITRQFKVSRAAVGRHKLEHLPETLRQAQALLEAEKGVNVAIELRDLFDRAKRLLDACDRWLEDPDNPGQYTIDPRAHEVGVVYLVPGENGKQVRKKSSLSSLLNQVSEEHPEIDYTLIESKTSDPRKLLLEACTVLKEQLSMFIQIGDIADIQDRILELERRLTDGHRIN